MNVFNKNCSYLFIGMISLLLMSAENSYSQVEDNEDFQFWSSVGVKYKLGKRLKFSLDQNLRMKEQANEVDEYFTEFGVEFEIFKDFELGVGLRHITENDNVGKKQGFENHFRYNVDLSYKYEAHRFDFSHRLRYQNKNQLGISVEDGDIPGENLRFKSSLGYNIRKWPLDPEFSVELFNAFRDGEQIKMNKYRITFGTEYDWDKIGEFGVYYRFEESTLINRPRKISVVGFNYTYSIN